MPASNLPAGLVFVLAFFLVMLLAVSGPLLRLHSFNFSRFATENRFLFSGEAMIRLQEDTSDLAQAYRWVRENTPLNSVLVEQPRKHSREELAALPAV